MKVKNLILYQVATDRNYKVGDVLSFGKIDNGQCYHTYNTSYQQNGEALHKIGFKSANKGVFKDKKMLVDLSVALEKYDFAFRELAIEEVRAEKFPDLPSRMKCMFLTDNKQECLKNLPNFAKKSYGKVYQAVAVEVTGEIFYARDVIVARNGMSLNEYKKEAIKYWNQNQNSTAEVKEILFEGKAKVVEILEEMIVNDKR